MSMKLSVHSKPAQISVVMLLLAVLSAHSQGTNGGQQQAPLERRIESISEHGLSLRRAFVEALVAAHIPGGIELVQDCSTPSLRIWPYRSWRVRDLLEGIISLRPELYLDDLPNTKIVLLRGRSGSPGLLDVRLPAIAIADIHNLTGSVDYILRVPVVQARIHALGLEPGRIELGFTRLSRPGAPPLPTTDPITLPEMSVRNALNHLALLSGSAVWVYEEDTCNQKHTFTISFDAK